MKKLKKQEELNFIITSEEDIRNEYLKNFGICTPNVKWIFKEHPSLFNQIVGFCKRVPDDVVEEMIEDEKYLPEIMTMCLSEENQIKFVELWPDKVQKYLQTLEENLGDGRGAFLCTEAQNLYDEIREEDPTLPEIKSYFNNNSVSNTPFAALAGLL